LQVFTRISAQYQVRYTAVWRPSTSGEVQVYEWSYEDFRKKYDELWNKGWRLHTLNNFVVNGQVLYTAVWKPSSEGEIQIYSWSYQDYRQKYDQLWSQGWRLKLIATY
jgi:Bacterial tandem repeat domain 1